LSAKWKAKRDDRSHSFWHAACEKFVNGKYASESAFLRSKDSGDLGIQDQRTFNRWLKQFRQGSLKNDDYKRSKSSPYDDVKAKLLEYIELRERLFKRDKCGLSWSVLKHKALHFAEQLGHKDFKAGDYFIKRVLDSGNKRCVSLHGEGMEMSEEEKAEKKQEFLNSMRDNIEKYNISLNRIYNADQTGLFFNKLPNRIYVDKAAKDYRGVKQMKSKDRVTLMVATSATGEKIPLFMVGKAKSPECFRLCDGKPPLPYYHQANAWFDKDVTVHWINRVLWPWHLEHHGNVYCLLLLDNCPAHCGLDSNKLPKKLILLFFPPNCTSFLQPADMGMIACLKVGYKAEMLRRLLAICDEPALFEEAMAAGARARRGCKGLAYCHKAHLLDAMEILQPIWSQDSKYARKESIQRHWRKAGLLTASEEADLENEIGRATVPNKSKTISNEDCEELCALFMQLETKTRYLKELPPALDESIVSEQVSDTLELKTIINGWVDIEEDEYILEDDLQEAIDELEQENKDDNEEYNVVDNDDVEMAEPVVALTWADIFKSCEDIRQFLMAKQLNSEVIAFESVLHKLRLKRMDNASSQLSIKSFFQKK